MEIWEYKILIEFGYIFLWFIIAVFVIYVVGRILGLGIGESLSNKASKHKEKKNETK